MMSRWVFLCGAVSLLGYAGCGDDGRDRPPSYVPVSSDGGEGGAAGGGGIGGMAPETCDEGEVRECKVQIDENNCFVGEQACLRGSWTPCDDPPTE
jgi:hypothetical protein